MKNRCNNCSSSELTDIFDLGKMPIAHKMLDFADEQDTLYPLSLQLCKNCSLIQIGEPIDPQVLYGAYNFCFSSWKPQPHAEDQARLILEAIGDGPVFEVACNDGMFLDILKQAGGGEVLGIEPNPAASASARSKGYIVYEEMLSEAACRRAVAEHGHFSAVVARQVVEHLGNLDEFFTCADILLSPGGCLFIDVPDIKGHMAAGDITFVWEEHVNYFTEEVLRFTLESRGFKITSLKRYDYSGGIMAVWAFKQPGLIAAKPDPEAAVRQIDRFKTLLEKFSIVLKEALLQLRQKGWAVVLFGAGCRASTLVNGLHLEDLIDYAVDDQRERQGMYMSGSRLEVRSSETFGKLSSPAVCLLAVNSENDQVVKTRVESVASAKVQFVSLLSPADILEEVRRLDFFSAQVCRGNLL